MALLADQNLIYINLEICQLNHLFGFVLAFAFDISAAIRLCECKFFYVNFINEFGHSKKPHEELVLNNLSGRIGIITSYKIALMKISF